MCFYVSVNKYNDKPTFYRSKKGLLYTDFVYKMFWLMCFMCQSINIMISLLFTHQHHVNPCASIITNVGMKHQPSLDLGILSLA